MEHDVINIGEGLINNYVFPTEKGCIVVDTGFPGEFEKFCGNLGKNGFSLTDITHIFITHAHNDHVGFFRELFDATDAPVILHSETVERLKEGMNRFIGGCPTRRAYEFLTAGEGAPVFPVVDVSDRALPADKNSDLLRKVGVPAEIMLLPGHTGDHIGFLMDDGRLFCGDAAMNGFPGEARHTPLD